MLTKLHIIQEVEGYEPQVSYCLLEQVWDQAMCWVERRIQDYVRRPIVRAQVEAQVWGQLYQTFPLKGTLEESL